jgi:D-beta-D-heptose 7-phosphate kinase/D-beta-D-heptose 1-phosphate adenosyltransferase
VGSPNILVIGDRIIDDYRICVSTRLCPEAPVPVLKETKNYTTEGGAGLVADQLKELIGCDSVSLLLGSASAKERIFADGRLLCRLDKDSIWVEEREFFYKKLAHEMQGIDLVIVSDYGKGAIDQKAAQIIMDTATHFLDVPVFVDAKKNWEWYNGAFAFFPNKNEHDIHHSKYAQHIIQKLGEDGCTVDGHPIKPEINHEVKDVTGAGDIFIASFAARYLGKHRFNQTRLHDAALYANHMAGHSVEHLGTYVVPQKIGLDFQSSW